MQHSENRNAAWHRGGSSMAGINVPSSSGMAGDVAYAWQMASMKIGKHQQNGISAVRMATSALA